MLTEAQLAKIRSMNHDEIQARFKEMKELISRGDVENITELQEEFDELSKRSKDLEENAKARSNFLNDLAGSIKAEPKVNPMPNTQARTIEDKDDMKYRSAFMEYVQRGVKSDVLKSRAAEVGTASQLGILIPQTIVQKVMTDLDKVRGHLYSSVKHTNLPGGIKYPIGNFKATFKRITETTVSDRQKAGEVTGYVEFGYLLGEIRIARTILQMVLTVDAFETKLAEVIVKAYVEAMDYEILNGKADANQCEGILTEAAKSNSRIAADHIIEMTEADMKDWKTWQTKFFAKIPLAMRSLSPEFVMTAGTYEANIKTLADNNNRPVYAETFNPVDGTETATFKAKRVQFVENDTFKDFDEAQAGEYFGMYWVGQEAYSINSNLQFGVTKYMDHETNQEVTKALVINDGKVLDPNYIFLLKKK